MGLLDGFFGGTSIPGEGLLSNIGNRLSNISPEQNRFILDMGMNMMANQDPTRPIGAMQALGVGYTKAQESQRGRRRDQMEDEQYRQSGETRQLQHRTALANLEKLNQRNDAINRLQEGYKSDPNFKPNTGDLMLADPDAAFRLMAPKSQTNRFSLEPKVGRNPTNGRNEYFIQNEGGETKWTDIEAPDALKYIPGNDYKSPQVFDPRSGNLRVPGGSPNGPAGPQAGGMDGMPPMPGALQQPSFAQVPQDLDAPWTHLRSPKEQDDMKKRVYELDSKRLAEMNEAVRTGRATLADLDRFNALNVKTGTGSLADRWGMPTFDDDKQEMAAITARLAPRQRVPGSGATSDFDAKMLLNGLPSIEKDGPANQQIRTGYEASINEAAKEKDFYDQFFLQRGHLKGADRAYAQQLARDKAEAEAKKSPRRPAPPASAAGSWPQINARYAAGAGQRQETQFGILQDELSRATDPRDREAIQREISRAQGGPRPAQPPANAGAGAGGGQTMTLSDIAETARRSGRSTAEVLKRAREKGFKIVGQ